MTHTSELTPGIQHLLRRDHERLDDRFAELESAFRADARLEVVRLWKTFEADLQHHLDLEERYLFPEFRRVNHQEAAHLTREHGEIRAALNDLGVGVELHEVNDTAFVHFANVLKNHARREDNVMYRWAQASLADSTQRHLGNHLVSGHGDTAARHPLRADFNLR